MTYIHPLEDPKIEPIHQKQFEAPLMEHVRREFALKRDKNRKQEEESRRAKGQVFKR